jgi:glycosyltransferase involved in cell wall biosynthesis
VVAFVGALGHDRNKGFDTLLDAWELLCARGGWDAELLAAGGGRGFEAWGREVSRRGLAGRVRLLGFTERVGELLAAADLLVSPARYEAYGLGAHEAVCRGVPALVSGRAGFAELYPAALSEMLLPRPDDAADLARRLLLWRDDAEGWRRRFAPLAESLRARTWDDMAAEFVAVVEGHASLRHF